MAKRRSKNPKVERSARARPRVGALDARDRAAVAALAAVGDDAASQLALLDALDALAAACPPGGVLARAMKRERDVRARACVDLQRARVREATLAVAVRGAPESAMLERTLEDAIAVVRAVEGETGELRTLALQLDDARRGDPGPPRPFFARFIEQARPRRAR